MRHFDASKCLALILVLLVYLTSRARGVVASRLDTVPEAQPYTTTAQNLVTRQQSYEENPSWIQWPPDCTTQDSTSCLGSQAVSTCTHEYCSHKVALTCWTHVYFIDFECLCSSIDSTTCTSCNRGTNRELYLAWLSQHCTKSPGWNDLPANWTSTLSGFEVLEVLEVGEVEAVSEADSSSFQTSNPFTSQFITDKHTFIDNVLPLACTSSCNWLSDKWSSSFVDGNVSEGLVGGGFSPNYKLGGELHAGRLYVDLSLFCVGWEWSDFQSNCQNLCTEDLEPTRLLLWLDATCGQVTNFTGLPGNWTDLLSDQRFELLPWTWKVAFEGPANDTSHHHCPPASGVLGTWAAVNFFVLFILTIMFLLLPIIGRRIGLKSFRLGCFGQQGSQRWYYTGPLIVALQLISNAINATIIKGTSGFGHISIKELLIFWCTRPRLEWLIVCLLPFQAELPMLLSASSSILFGEVILQLCAGYYIGITVNFANRHDFYLEGRLPENWYYATQAKLMYSGAILWLVSVLIALPTCLWIVLGGLERMSWWDKDWIGTKKLANEQYAFGSEEASQLQRLQDNIAFEGRQDHLSVEIDAVLEEWDELKLAWNSMSADFCKVYNNQRAIQKKADISSHRLDGCREGTKSWQARREAKEEAEWYQASLPDIPAKKQGEARRRQQHLLNQINLNQRENSRVGANIRSWDGLIRQKANLQQSWAAYEERWTRISERMSEYDKDVNRFPGVVLVFVVAMFIVWIARWL